MADTNKRYWLTEADVQAQRAVTRAVLGDVEQGVRIPGAPAINGRGGGGKFYKAAEDLYPSRDWFFAQRCTRLGVVASGTDYDRVYKWGTHWANMRAGYIVAVMSIDGELCCMQGEGCIPTTCASSGASITLTPNTGEATNGTVDVSYTFTGITTAGLSSAMTATGLPPGLTLSGTTISGTPTTAGVYHVILTGPKTGGCDVKRVLRIVIDPAPEE